MKTLRIIAAICLLSFILSNISYGQTDNKSTDKVKYNTWSVTASGGQMLFYGDLRQFDFYPLTKQNFKDWYPAYTQEISERRMGFGISVSKQLSTMFAVQGVLNKGKLSGVKIQSTKAYFETDFLYYGANLVVNFSNLFWPYTKNHKLSFYGLAGIGFTDFKAKQYKLSNDAVIHSEGYGEFGQDGKKTTETTVPVGLGLKYKLSKKFDFGIESSLANVNTDKLDAHVAHNTAKDKWGYTSLTLTYKIGKNEKSLEWVTPKEMESDELAPLFAKINKKIDSLGQKLNDLDARVTKAEKDIELLKNPPTEADDDADGVPNSKDLEPGTAKGNLVNFQGITIPKGTGTAFAKPQFSVFFEVNSSVISETQKEKVAAAAQMLKDDPSLKFDLVGHADKTGGAAYNDILSKARSQAVYDMLTKSFGIEAGRLTVEGKGYNDPLAVDILSVNRRVDFIKK